MSDLAMKIAEAAMAAGIEDDEILDADDELSMEPPDESEELEAGGVDDQEAEDDDGPSEDEVTPQRKPAKEADTTVSRLIRNMKNKERELATERSSKRQLEEQLQSLDTELKKLKATGADPSDDDIVDAIKAFVVRRERLAGSDDPKLQRLLQELASDLTSEVFGDADEIASLKERKQQRNKERQEREKFKAYDKQLADMKREKEELQQREIDMRLLSDADQFLKVNSASVPYFLAAFEAEGLDPREHILATAKEMVRSGQVPDPTTKKELADLYAVISNNYEQHYEHIHQHLAKASGSSASAATKAKKPGAAIDIRKKNAKEGTPSREGVGGNKKRATDAARGGGGRGAPGPSIPREAGTNEDLATRVRRAELAARRR